MTNPYGLWATLIDAGSNPQLSAFWRRRLMMLVPTSQTSPTLSRRAMLCLVVAGALTIGLPTYRVVAAVDEQPSTPAAAQNDQTKKLTVQEFAQLSEDQQKAALLDGVQGNQRRYSNISLKTTSGVQIIDVDAVTKQPGKVLEHLGFCGFELRRIEGSYRITLIRHRPGIEQPTVRSTNHYNAKAGVSRAVATRRLANGDQEYGLISTLPSRDSEECRYGSYLGGVIFVGFAESDFFGFLLEQRKDVKIRGIDQQTGLVEVYFDYKEEARDGTGSCTMWFDPSKDWLLARRVWERKRSRSQSYERFEVKESQIFDGIWMPTRFTEVTWESIGGRTMGNLWETTAEDIKIGQMKEEDLEVVFLPGTLVCDEITGERWGVGKSGEKVPYNYNVGGGP